MHVEVLQPAVERVERRLGATFAPSEIERELGGRHLQVIKMLTDYIMDGVDDSLAALSEYIDKLEIVTKSMYPEHVVIGMLKPPSMTAAP